MKIVIKDLSTSDTADGMDVNIRARIQGQEERHVDGVILLARAKSHQWPVQLGPLDTSNMAHKALVEARDRINAELDKRAAGA